MDTSDEIPKSVQTTKQVLDNIYNHGFKFDPRVIAQYLLINFAYEERLIPIDDPIWRRLSKFIIKRIARIIQADQFILIRDTSALHAAIHLGMVTNPDLQNYVKNRDECTQNLLSQRSILGQ